MKRSFSIVLLSTFIVFNCTQAFIPPAAVGAASLLFARRFTVSVITGDFLINLGKMPKEKSPLLTLKEQSEAVLRGMHNDFFDACKGVNYIAQTTFSIAEEIFKKAQKEKQKATVEKPTDPEDIKKEEEDNNNQEKKD